MAGITLTQAQAHLDEWLAADLAVSKGQAYSIGGRSLSRADAATIRENIEFWDRQVKRLSRGGIKVFGGTPV
ncbi:MAG: DUF6148 family protein [Deltaproteobacteria bacterium]|nr:DUF6148 family protein [Deltaproteobacteria bacterium]